MATKKITLVEAYGELTSIINQLQRREMTVAGAQANIAALAIRVNKQIDGVQFAVPSVAELEERYSASSLFESSDNSYEESYESSTC